ncbi:FUSC family protein [Pseudomonas sp. LS44]|uniref:FUSC family protein n=1 Tax=Pseudomonas sp. LS44 TaxID=1357074 RepID=UPI00215AC6CD|nr:FUSC family protein [Pseudomonas sp. LS44]UVE18923.1 FUSC family protein [Pseudomonas sp. LS44]
MNGQLGRPLAAPLGETLRRACYEWARTDGVTWIYIAKVLIAVFLTLWLAMRLELPQPSTACITVFIVMQPQSGQVFAKGFYRLIGTVIGLSVMMVLIALFAQERVLFLLTAGIWIGLCTAGAARYRDFRAYACVLAGYTATLIGVPATTAPDTAFMQAIWRLLEICLGVGVATLVSAVIIPQSVGASMRNALYVRFGAFSAFMLDNLRHKLDQRAFASGNMRFASEAVGLEAMRSASSFEDPHMRLRSGRLARMNNEFMVLTTRFHAFHRLRERLLLQGDTRLLEALQPCLEPLEELLGELRDRPLTDSNAAVLAERLSLLREQLRPQIRQARAALDANNATQLLDFNSASELLYRLVDDLHNYSLTHASLAARHHEREQWDANFSTKANPLAAAVAGVRTGMMIILFGAFWIVSAWPSGAMFALNGVAILALASSSPNPPKMAAQMAMGTALSAVLGISLNIFVMPLIDGFPLLCLVLSPVFVFGIFLSTRPQWAGYGVGMLIFFCVGALPANPIAYNPAGLFNNYLALVLAQGLSAVVIAVFLPPNSPWLWRRLHRDLRQRVVFAVSGPAPGLVANFESGTRDLLNQAYGLAASRPDVQSDLMRWAFLVLEIGHAVIELRHEQERLPALPRYAEATAWRQAIRALGRSLIRLFVKPSADNLQRALSMLDQAIASVHANAEPDAQPFDDAPLRRVQSYLHFIRSALLDPHSPLTERVTKGVPHAA